MVHTTFKDNLADDLAFLLQGLDTDTDSEVMDLATALILHLRSTKTLLQELDKKQSQIDKQLFRNKTIDDLITRTVIAISERGSGEFDLKELHMLNELKL